MIVACVEVEDYLGRGKEYVSKMRSMVARNLREPHEFVVLTDSAARHGYAQGVVEIPPNGLSGWWMKLNLFQPQRFPNGERILYLDLDVVITGSLDALAQTKGIIHLTDWGWKVPSYGSGVMIWNGGEHSEIWTEWKPEFKGMFRGDQDWITKLGGWPALSSTLLRSYRYHCKQGIPEGCSVVSFHGRPKVHEAPDAWIKELWA